MTDKDYKLIALILAECNNDLDCELTDTQFEQIKKVFNRRLGEADHKFDKKAFRVAIAHYNKTDNKD